MLQILNVYFSSTFTASSSDFANGSSIVFTYYVNLVDLGTIGLEMSMIHNIKLWQDTSESLSEQQNTCGCNILCAELQG